MSASIPSCSPRPQGVALNPMPAEIQRFASFFLTMDPPQHTVYRRLISSAFTPRNVRQIEEQIHRNAVAIVDDLVGAGEVDFVAACSARAADADDHGHARRADGRPTRGGVRRGEAVRHERRRVRDAEERADDPVAQITLLSTTGVELAKFRRTHPGDDLMTEHRQRRGRRAPADRRGDRCIPDPAGVGGQRHHQAGDDARDDGARGQPGSAGLAAGGLRRPNRFGDRGIRPLVLAGAAVRPLRHRGHRASTAHPVGWGQGRVCSTARRTGTSRLRPPGAFRSVAARRTRTSVSAAAVRTSAWATSLPKRSCETCSMSC